LRWFLRDQATDNRLAVGVRLNQTNLKERRRKRKKPAKAGFFNEL
jgi:hypothetical protein